MSKYREDRQIVDYERSRRDSQYDNREDDHLDIGRRRERQRLRDGEDYKEDRKRRHSHEKTSTTSTYETTKKKSSTSSNKKFKSNSRRKHSDDDEDDDEDASDSSSSSSRKSSGSLQRRRKAIAKLERKKLKDEYQQQKESQVAAQIANNLGYNNQDNPFGDSNLSQKFVWFKKREKEVKQGITSAERSKRDAELRREKELELERLNKRRAEREIETQLREQEQLRMARDTEQAALGDWEDREKEFHLHQAKTRAQIRIKEGRAKAIDVLAMNISLTSGNAELADEFDALGLEPDQEEPYEIFKNLSLREVEELHEDIQLYLELEKDADNIAFWQAMMVVCDDELARKGSTINRAKGNHLHEGTAKDIDNMLKEKSPAQLSELQRKVEETLAKGGTIDVDYWEAVLKAIIVARSKAKLRNMHRTMLKRREAQLKKRKQEQAEEIRVISQNRRTFREAIFNSSHVPVKKNVAEEDTEKMENKEESESVDEEIVEEYHPRMSPKPMTELSRDDRQLDIWTPDDDARELKEARERVIQNHDKKVDIDGDDDDDDESKQKLKLSSVLKMGQNAPSSPTLMTAEDLFVAKASEAMEAGEVIFGKKTGEEVDLSSSTAYTWQDKYRPRKPRYFNRVQTGYEWNKYNQTHYDPDNPPPKIVQGYKFNIFYPDLIDRGRAPTFKMERDAGWPETCIIRFIAGPPYEDIAFRIVNKDWERSHKKGFRSSFDRGVLQLHFNFRRTFYRR